MGFRRAGPLLTGLYSRGGSTWRVDVPLFRWLSLRQLLTVPYVVLVMGLAMVVGGLSYRAGREAVDHLADSLLIETVGRISQAVERHVLGSGAVLETAFPKGVPAPVSVQAELAALRTRFWLATSVHRELNNYAYYGDEQGHFFGLWRDGPDDAQLRLRVRSEGPRTLYKFSGIHGELGDAKQEDKVFEPRQRPWYQAGRSAATETWTSIYIDFRTQELVATRARKVPDALGVTRGVVATDVSLQHLSDFVRSLKTSANGFAFIVEPSGDLIATSRGSHIRKGIDGAHLRQNAADVDDPLLAGTYQKVRALMAAASRPTEARAGQIEGPDGTALQIAYARMRDTAGLDWIIAVAVPRSDFLHQVTTNLYQTMGLTVLAALAVVGVGLISLGVVSRDLNKIATAARQVGEGQFDAPLKVDRHDEIGELAQSFAAMTHKLATDRLTGLANREAMLRRISDRIGLQRRTGDDAAFALLFLDLDGFKSVNDRFGHEAGDQVLRVMGQRMTASLRDGDLVARWAGDEFLIVLDGIAEESHARGVADKLQSSLFAEPIAGAEEARVGVSIGLALYPRDGVDVEALVRHADADMYRRKRA